MKIIKSFKPKNKPFPFKECNSFEYCLNECGELYFIIDRSAKNNSNEVRRAIPNYGMPDTIALMKEISDQFYSLLIFI